MAIFNPSGLSVGWCVGHVPPHRTSATLIVKGTFRLRPGAPAVLADVQEMLSGDVHEEEDPGRSLRYPSDFAWFKRGADLLLVGTCHVPGGRPNPVCRVTFQVGTWYKQLAVIGDRTRKTRFIFFSSVSEPASFQKMKLSYEYSFGGRNYPKNPTGRGYRDERMPNVEDLERLITDPDSRPDPAGFGPIPLAWPQRAHGLGTFDPAWLRKRWPGFPADCEWTVFQAAPRDQQLEAYLRGDEKLFLEHLHPTHRVYESRLPALRLRWLLRGKAGWREVPLHLDTLWIDMDAEKLVLVWRGVTGVQDRKMRGTFDHLIVSEPQSEAVRPIDSCVDLYVPTQPKSETPPEIVLPPSRSELSHEAALAARLAAVYESLKSTHPDLAAEVGPPPSLPEPTKPEPWTRESCRAHFEKGGVLSGQDLSGLDLSDLDLTGASFAKANLAGARMRKANLKGADLAGAVLSDADLGGANLEGADLSLAKLNGANLDGVSAGGATFFEADLSGATLRDAVLNGADFGSSVLARADFRRATLVGASAVKARGPEVVLEGADLTGFQAGEGADFARGNFRSVRAAKSVWEEAKLDGADFTRASLSRANFSAASAKAALFALADLKEARLAEAHLEGANLTQANLFRADLEGSLLVGASFLGSNLYEAEFLNAGTAGADFGGAELTGSKLAR